MKKLYLAAFLFLAVPLTGVPAFSDTTGGEPAYRGFSAGAERNDIVPGEFIIDPPTFENLGFRWYIEGDSNRNATVKVAYRRRGTRAWRPAQPLLRVHHELVERAGVPYRTGNLFAGSVLFLEPGTEYDVRLTMRDPDGGAPAAPKTVSVTTRTEARAWSDGRTLTVYPADHQGARLARHVFDSPAAAWDAARPGDVIYLAAGTHEIREAPMHLAKSGTPGRPIVFRGAGADRTVIKGPDMATDLFRLAGDKHRVFDAADHLVFEDLTLRRANIAINGGSRGGPGASWLTVRRCRIEEVIGGAWTTSENSRNWYIADNVITGIDPEWHPRTTPQRGYMDGSHTGINIYGQGHAICRNRVSRFSDSVAVYNFTNPASDDILRHAVNIDIYNNDLSRAIDDTIEADFGGHNIRVYNNLCYNTHTALSVQPAYGGPVYLVRNVAYGVTIISYKWNVQPAGILAWHNTTVSAAAGFSSPMWSNSHLRNNLVIGNGGKISTGTFTPDRTTLDYNGYRGGAIRWTQGDEERRDYATLADFTAATGHERHGIEVDFDIFERAEPVKAGFTYKPADFDLRLRAGARAVDAGIRLANINDDYTGAAPDLGAYEHGRPLPWYGPRAAANFSAGRPRPETTGFNALFRRVAADYRAASFSDRRQLVELLADRDALNPAEEKLLLAAADDDDLDIRAAACRGVMKHIRPAHPAWETLVAAAESSGNALIRDIGRQMRFEAMLLKDVRLPEGNWRFKTDPDDAGEAAGWHRPDLDDADWRADATTGADWRTFLDVRYYGIGWYRREITVPEFSAGDTVQLYFGGVDECARVWLDGHYLGEHNLGPGGWNVPFTLDATHAARPGVRQQLTVKAWNTAGGGGIWQPVNLLVMRGRPQAVNVKGE